MAVGGGRGGGVGGRGRSKTRGGGRKDANERMRKERMSRGSLKNFRSAFQLLTPLTLGFSQQVIV